MAKPTTRGTLQDYCLRNLGAPVIEINVDEDQIEDRTDDALQFYQEFHSDGTIREYLKHELTAADITNSYITVADSVMSVVRMLKINSTTGNSLFDMGYHMRMNDIFMLQGLSTQMQTYEQAQQKLSLIDHRLNSEEHVRFSRHMNRIHVDEGFDDLLAGNFVVLEVVSVIDPGTYGDVYNDLYLKKYLTALLKRQWGANMMKFDGFQLPGGITLNGRQMFEDAIEEIKELEEECRLIWMSPDNFLMG
jgi:hypothetical protein|tara:strand:+ start:195 stop:938 length:744 start_codon:yes stop_codon:yes gene_type:complete